MPAINSVILVLVFSVASITAEPIFFGGRRGRHRHIPTLPPLPSQFRLGSHNAAPRFTVKTQYIDAPALKSFQNSINTKEAPVKENATKESDIIKLADISDISGDILLSDDVASVTEVDVEDSTATEAPAELRELKSEFENNINNLLNENTKQKSITDILLDLDSENVIIDSIFTHNVSEQSLESESIFKAINEKAASDNKIPNFVKPPEVAEQFGSILTQNVTDQSLVTDSFFTVFNEKAASDIKIHNFINLPEVVEPFTSEDNSNKESTDSIPRLLADSVTETVAKHIIQELTTTESVIVTFTNLETESITITKTEYSSVSYTPVFITITDLVVETDCITLDLPNTVTFYDTKTVTTRLTEYIQYSQITVPAVKTVTDTRYFTLTVTPSPVSIVQTITDLHQVKTCTCLI